MNIHGGNARPVLLCPACWQYGTARTVKPGKLILHSRADDVALFADGEELVRNSGLPAPAEVGTDHRPSDPEPVRKMSGRAKGRRRRPDGRMTRKGTGGKG